MGNLANGGIIKHRGSDLVINTAGGCDYLIPKGSALAAKSLEGTPGWYVPAGQDNCPHCGDTNFNETDRLCISCNHVHPEHNSLDCEQFCRR